MLSANDEERVRKLESRILSLEAVTGYETKPAPAKWYENIPEGGVLCWCKDGESDKESIGQITEKGKANGYYTASYNHWIYATPLTLQEISVFVINAPEEV